MKKLIILLLAGLLTQPVSAQNIQNILDNNSKALGVTGRKSFPALQTRGHVIVSGTEAKMPFKLLQSRPDRLRIETSVFGFKAIQTYDGTTAWSLSPTQGMEAVKTDVRDMEFIAAATSIDGPFSYNKNEKYVMRYLGADTYREIPVEVVLWASDSERLIYYINKKTWLVEGVRYEYEKNGGWYSMEYRVQEYQEFKGAKFPSEVTAYVNGVEMVNLFVTDLKLIDEPEAEYFGKPSYTQ